MKEMILLKNGEIALKGLNRATFEDVLVKNMRRRIEPLGKFTIRKAQSTIFVEPKDETADMDEAFARLRKVFGVAALARACVVEKDLEAIKQTAAAYLEDDLLAAKSFKVAAKRSDKKFAYNSPEICQEVGGYLLSRFPHLHVDVHQPQVVVEVEVRDFGAYIHAAQIPGAGGMPVGTSGKAMLLVSGGLDSPVACYMMAKRGLQLDAVHFVSPPYTSERAKRKVIDLLQQLGGYCGTINLLVVPFTELQERIRDNCPEDLFTIIMRRCMMHIAERLAEQRGCSALITGESLAQVASQTLPALVCTDAAANMPVFRPLIGMDKEEIVRIARQIGTFEISIQPFEDCCTVFTPKHPRTRPNLRLIETGEQNLDADELIERAIAGTERLRIDSTGGPFSENTPLR